MQPISPKPVWYKTKAGIIFIILLSLISMVLLSFGILVGYYTLQLTFGDSEKLAAQFSGGQFSESSDLANAIQNRAPVTEMSQIIRPHNPTFGNKEATVTIIAFIDFECPYCARSYPIFKQIMNKYEPAVNIVFKHLPLTSIHPNALPAALASTCAQEQDAFWSYYDLLFENNKFNQEAYLSYAKELGLNQTAFLSCLEERKYETNITEDVQDAISIGAKGTPTYVIQNRTVSGVIPQAVWDQLILESL